ncbi:MAG: hypothetical protein ACK5HZ_04710 [Macellibacteroides fermentans]|uniref:hypothetical protein n=1 Tax=Macellibacteroides fermentans TaxID=879969 RepID=UPI003AC5348E
MYKHAPTAQTHGKVSAQMLSGCLLCRAGWLVCTLVDFVWPGIAIHAAAGQRSNPSDGGVGVTVFIVSLLEGYYAKGSSLPFGVTIFRYLILKTIVLS